MQRESIKMSKYWEEQLASMPYLSRKYLSIELTPTFSYVF